MLHAALSRTVPVESSLNQVGITDLTWHQVHRPSISPQGDRDRQKRQSGEVLMKLLF